MTFAFNMVRGSLKGVKPSNPDTDQHLISPYNITA